MENNSSYYCTAHAYSFMKHRYSLFPSKRKLDNRNRFMGKIIAPKDDRPNVCKQKKFKMIIVYKKVQIKVRITN